MSQLTACEDQHDDELLHIVNTASSAVKAQGTCEENLNCLRFNRGKAQMNDSKLSNKEIQNANDNRGRRL